MSPALNRLHYTPDRLSSEEIQEQQAARLRYRLLMKWFSSHFAVLMDNVWVHPSYIVNCSLAEFAAAVLLYKQDVEHTAPVIEYCTAKQLKKVIMSRLNDDHPAILKYFARKLDEKHKRFHWTGSKIIIRRWTPAFANFLKVIPVGERMELVHHPIYLDHDPAADLAQSVGDVNLHDSGWNSGGDTGGNDDTGAWGTKRKDRSETLADDQPLKGLKRRPEPI